MRPQEFEQVACDFMEVFWMLDNLNDADIVQGCMLKLECLALEVNNVDIRDFASIDLTTIADVVLGLQAILVATHKYCNSKQLLTMKNLHRRIQMLASRINN